MTTAARSKTPCREPRNSERRLIINADDFGLDVAVNEAVERAHVDGVLASASLMVGARAAADAIARSQRLSGLRVGLHLVLADGAALLPAARIAALVDARGEFDPDMVRAGVRFFFSPRVRRQLADEIEAQFAAFAATGLHLDHVNAHKHFHLHPSVLGLILDIGRRYGLAAVRLPREPRVANNKRSRADLAGHIALAPWLRILETRLRRAGIAHNDHVFGLSASGQMDEARLLQTIAALPPGITEIYTHPATRNGLRASMADYNHRGELAALLSARVRTALDAQGAARIGYADLVRA